MFLFAEFDMSHLYFIFKQDICSTECKKYSINPVNMPWVYTQTVEKLHRSIFGGEGGGGGGANKGRGLILEEKHFNMLSVKRITFQPKMVRITFI